MELDMQPKTRECNLILNGFHADGHETWGTFFKLSVARHMMDYTYFSHEKGSQLPS